MLTHTLSSTIKIFCFLLISSFAFAQTINEPKDVPADWSQSYEPFQIAGNLYYVGTYDLACYLITTPKGHILINTGLAGSASMIKTSVESLGFKFSDIKILLTTQAHYDHMGAMAAIKEMTGAKMMVDEKDADVMLTGGSSDYALGSYGSSYKSLKADRLLKDGDIISLGNMKLTMLHHPGHTKGSCSFIFDVKDDRNSYKVLIANMPTIVTEKAFSEIPEYPGIADDYAYTLTSLKKLSFDIWLASHASQFGLHKKRKPGDAYNPSAFKDRIGYDNSIKSLEEEYLKKVEEK